MIPLIPISIKFPENIHSQIGNVSKLIGYSQNHLVLELVQDCLEMIQTPGEETVPKVVLFAQAALNRQKNKPKLKR